MKIVKPRVELHRITYLPEQAIEVAGRTAYKSEDKITDTSAAGFVERMRKLGHGATLEFADAHFKIWTDRGITHEIVRHRIASFLQESTRYCDYNQGKYDSQISVIKTPGLDVHPDAEAVWTSAQENAESYYKKLRKLGVKAEFARSVLTNATKAEINVKCNFREWLHICDLRTSPKAHPQIRNIMYACWSLLREYAPAVFEWMDESFRQEDVDRWATQVDIEDKNPLKFLKYVSTDPDGKMVLNIPDEELRK